MRLLIMGPPGAGKGTQAAHLAEWAGVPAISTGDILRANVATGTELGKQARRFMDAGEYVPDSLTNSMVRSRIAEPDAAQGFLLDGYPRTLAQVVELDAMLEADGHWHRCGRRTHGRPGRTRAASGFPSRGSATCGRHGRGHPAAAAGVCRADRVVAGGLQRSAAARRGERIG